MIETRDLTKMYGDLYALNRLTLKLERGDVYGFIGPNGAGKTTTMRILATLLNPTWGEATVCGYSIYNGAKEIRRLMGYMPDFFGVYDDMKVVEYLEFFAAAYRIKGPERRRKCDQVLELVDLGYKRDALVTSLSRGMTQRLGLARVLLHEPQVLLLDEPASGLDPRARIEMRGLLKELRNMGKTILVSSHILPELADICNKIGIIERGKLLFDGDVQSAIRQVRQHTVINVSVADGQTPSAQGFLHGHPDILSCELKEQDDVLHVTLNDGVHDGSFIADILVKNGLRLRMLKEEEIDLEDVFMGITKGITTHHSPLTTMRILVTGGAGYIGSHAVRLFLSRGHDVWVYDNLSMGHRAAVPAERLVVGDLAEVQRLDHALLAHRIEAVVHFAAFTYVGESVQNPGKYYQNNLVNTLNLMECLRRQRIGRFVFSSTAATYGVPERVPITEDEPQRPINPYGTGKLAVERALADYAAAYGWGYAALRYFNASGASPDGDLGEDHDPETHLIPLVLQSILGQRPHIEVFGTDYPTPDGTCVRDYIHVDDLASAHLLALERLEPGKGLCYNLGIGRGYSVREVIRAAEEVTGKPVPVKEGPRRPGDPPVLVASSDKVRRELDWQPRYQELRPIIETAWKWHRGHPKGYAD